MSVKFTSKLAIDGHMRTLSKTVSALERGAISAKQGSYVLRVSTSSLAGTVIDLGLTGKSLSGRKLLDFSRPRRGRRRNIW